MPEITMRSADAVIALADGTNMSSIEKISYFLNLVSKEEDRIGEDVGHFPVIIMLNKADLVSNGVYIGFDVVKRFIDSEHYEFIETSMRTGEGVDDSIRILLSKLGKGSV
jgi:signal recognition particle receptor subunit beta